MLPLICGYTAQKVETASFLSSTTDASFTLTKATTNYGELLRDREYILELNEFDDIHFKGKQPVHNFNAKRSASLISKESTSNGRWFFVQTADGSSKSDLDIIT